MWSFVVSEREKSGQLVLGREACDLLDIQLYHAAGNVSFADLAACKPQLARECLFTVGSFLLRHADSARVRTLAGEDIAAEALDGRAATRAIMQRQLDRDLNPEGAGLARIEVYQSLPLAGLRRAIDRPDKKLLGVIEDPSRL